MTSSSLNNQKKSLHITFKAAETSPFGDVFLFFRTIQTTEY